MKWHYLSTEDGIWEVGNYDHGGEWVPESSHDNLPDATKRVNFLNGFEENKATRLERYNPPYRINYQTKEIHAFEGNEASGFYGFLGTFFSLGKTEVKRIEKELNLYEEAWDTMAKIIKKEES